MSGAESQRFANNDWCAGCGVQLITDGQIPGQQAKTDRDAVGMQAVADQVVEIMPFPTLSGARLHRVSAGHTRGPALSER
jgi:hypothetical protein